jgi:hypothetical protein
MASDSTSAGSTRSDSSRQRLIVLSIVLIGISYVIQLYEAGTVSWRWLFIGIVSWMIAAGPVASTSYGKSVGAWFRRIGYGGRLIAIIAVAGVFWSFIFLYQPPMVPSISFAAGGLIGLMGVYIGERFDFM